MEDIINSILGIKKKPDPALDLPPGTNVVSYADLTSPQARFNRAVDAIKQQGWHVVGEPDTQKQSILGAVAKAAQHVIGPNAQAQTTPMPMPTPADNQFSNQLAQIPNDPGARYNPIIAKAATENNVPESLLKAVLAHESMQFNPKYVGGYHTDQHGRGIAGLDDRYNQNVSDQQAFDPLFAIPYAAQKLQAMHQSQGDWGKALRYYNGGGNYASSQPGYQGVPINQRTMDYLNNVYKQSQYYANGK